MEHKGVLNSAGFPNVGRVVTARRRWRAFVWDVADRPASCPTNDLSFKFSPDGVRHHGCG